LFQFRIAILLSRHSAPIVSEPSVVISTLPDGVPASAPTIVRATAIDASRISVSWEPGPFPNGPVLSYVLQINELPEGYSALKVSKRGPYHACAQLPLFFQYEF
jgi:proto-oncogene tyrosine-protein kinase ROS